MSWYKTGTINVTKGSNIVTGIGTKWANQLLGISAGRMLLLQSSNQIEIYEIASVQSDTQLTLADDYRGESKTGGIYQIPTSPTVSIESLALRISEMLNYYQTQLNAWQTILTGDGKVTLTAPDGSVVTIISQYSIQQELIKLIEESKVYVSESAKNASNAQKASTSATDSANAAKTSADSANKSATAASVSAKNASDSANSIKTSETNAKTSANAAAKSADDAKSWASTVDTSTFVKKSGDTVTGQLTFEYTAYGMKFKHENSDSLIVIRPEKDSFCFLFYNEETKKWTNKFKYASAGNTWRFEDVVDVAINGKSVLKDGDAVRLFGDLSDTSLNTLDGLAEGVYFQGKNILATSENGYPVNQAGSLNVIKNGADGAGCCQIYTTYRSARQFIRNYRGGTKTWEPWIEQITTANVSADIVGALPAVKTVVNNTPTYMVGGAINVSSISVNGQQINPILNHIQVINSEIDGRTDIASSGWQSYFTVRDDGLCGVWNSPQQKWRFLFDGDGNLLVGNVCYNQDWYNLTNERQAGVMYTNTTGKPIMVSISCKSGSLWISKGVEVARSNGSSNMSAIVPHGVSYAFSGEMVLWSELR